MSEPASSAVTGITIAAGAVTLTGSIFGLQYDALLFGLLGGLISLMHLEPAGKGKTAAILASAAILGALFAPVLVAVALDYMGFLKAVATDILRLGSAASIGLTAQIVIPLVFKLIRRRVDAA